jgi:hypothetical protein
VSDELSIELTSELSAELRELAARQESRPVLTGAEIRGRAVRRGRRRVVGGLGAGAVAFAGTAFALTVGFTHSDDDGNGRQLPAATHADPVPSPRVTSTDASTPVPRAPVTGTVVLGKRVLIVGGRVMPMTSGLPDSPELAGPLTVYKKHETKVVTVTDLAGGVAYTTEEVVIVRLAASSAAALLPTPGGIGSLDAALVFALTASGTTVSAAASVVLGYRLLTVWLPLIPGLLVLGVLVRRKAL